MKLRIGGVTGGCHVSLVRLLRALCARLLMSETRAGMHTIVQYFPIDSTGTVLINRTIITLNTHIGIKRRRPVKGCVV